MSYDIYVEIDTGGPEPATIWTADPTYNFGPMFREAFGDEGIKGFDGKPADEVGEALLLGIKDMRNRPDHYRQFDAPNGWGTYDGGILEVLDEWADACLDNPKAKVRVTMTNDAKGAISEMVAPHGHTIERCLDHDTTHCTRCCGARPVGRFAGPEPYCGVLFEIAGGGDAFYCNRQKGHIGVHSRMPWSKNDE